MGDGGPAIEAPLRHPTAVTVDVAGNVYVTSGGLVRKINQSGTISTFLYPEGAVQGIVTDDVGDVYLALTHQIIKVNAENQEQSIIAGTGEGGFRGEPGPAGSALLSVSRHGIAVDMQGRVWFADRDNRRIRVVEPVPSRN